MKPIALLAAILLATSCGSVSPYDADKPSPNTVSINALKELCTAQTSVVIRSDYVIRGIIVANDMFGEYDRSIVVNDSDGGLEIYVDRRRCYTTLRLGAEVEIYCNSLALGRYGSRIVLGAQPTGGYSVDRIASQDIERYIHIVADRSLPAPAVVPVAGINNSHIDRYVKVEGLTFIADDCAAWCDRTEGEGFVETTHVATDGRGNSLTVICRGSATYAATPLPRGESDITGIIEYRNGEYLLRPANVGASATY